MFCRILNADGVLFPNQGRAALSSKGFRYRLLAAQNIQRPQLKFKDTLDNSPMPFVPKIHAKPHALKTLEGKETIRNATS